MEHAKKLMLVEPRLFRPTMREKTLSRLDDEIERTLASDLPDDEKAKRYIAASNKYKHYDVTEKPLETKKKEDTSVEYDVMQSVPPDQKYRAKRLLDYLKRDTDVRIGENGEFIYKQQRLPHSHIVDLVNDVLRKKSSHIESPKGWKEFSESLKAVNVPRDLVVNEDRWRHMHAPAKRQTKVDYEDTPSKKKQRKPSRKSWIEY